MRLRKKKISINAVLYFATINKLDEKEKELRQQQLKLRVRMPQCVCEVHARPLSTRSHQAGVSARAWVARGDQTPRASVS